MPQVSGESNPTPASLKPFLYHGIRLAWRNGDKQASGDCPFCGKDNKFSVNLETSKWKCWSCNENDGGNSTSFLQTIHRHSLAMTTDDDYSELSKNRHISASILKEWQLCRSLISREWLVPAYGVSSKHPKQLYKYFQTKPGGKMLLLPTPESGGAAIFGMNKHSADRPLIFITEGPWDGMKLYELLASRKLSETGLMVTGNPDVSILSQCNVISLPGCNTFLESWLPLVCGKMVFIMFDNDHPNPSTGAMPGRDATKRLVNYFYSRPMNERPSGVYQLEWSVKGYDPDLPSGYDVRDALKG